MAADLENPLVVRFYRWNRATAVRRGENEHRKRLLAGLSGRVVEVGSGDGVNLPFYPPTVEQLIAIEPERTFRAAAERAAAEAPVPVSVQAGVGEDLPLDDASVDAAVAALVLCTVPASRGVAARAAPRRAPGRRAALLRARPHRPPAAQGLPRRGRAERHLAEDRGRLPPGGRSAGRGG